MINAHVLIQIISDAQIQGPEESEALTLAITCVPALTYCLVISISRGPTDQCMQITKPQATHYDWLYDDT